jgi:hypothetical protein
MKRLFVLAAGTLGTVGAALAVSGVITAAPALAACSPQFVCDVLDQPATFVDSIATAPQQFQQSIVTAPDVFLNGTCGFSTTDPAYCPDPENPVVGVLNQPAFFVADLASQPATFAESINPANQLNTFFNDPEVGIFNQPQTFIKSITEPFGPQLPEEEEEA